MTEYDEKNFLFLQFLASDSDKMIQKARFQIWLLEQ